ncbi:hypothetical protein [Hydrogenophaga defluvii]|uniref:Uncharacterized protein n=1 Tax=Hydrogenophaga defluvii TaxID=249410 RepID=A0ABW2SGT2_9BURK
MRFNPPDNSDPRWDETTRQAIERKVDEAMALAPRLEIDSTAGPLSHEERRVVLRASFNEFVKGASLDHLMTAPPALLEQFSVMALVKDHNIKGELVQLIRVFMMAYADPELNEAARQALASLEASVTAQILKKGPPSWGKFLAMPGSPSARPVGPTR